MSLAYKAMLLAREIHKNQVRKYTGSPYVEHLAEVAGIVAATTANPNTAIEIDLAVAWLHDCMEDQGVERETLNAIFGKYIADAVFMLSDLETGNRADRKSASRERLSHAASWVQTIKVADLISNTQSIVLHDPKFAETYLAEKSLLLDVLTKAHEGLLAIARKQVDDAWIKLGSGTQQ